MLRKYLFGIFVLLVLVPVFAPSQANKSVQFTPAFGIAWDQLYLWTIGLSVDVYLTKHLTISPEFFMANKKIGFGVSKDEDRENYDFTYFLQPGVMLNYHHPSFFGGVGVVKSYQARNEWHYEGSSLPRRVVWEVGWDNVWKLKINVGYKISNFRLAVFFLSDFSDIGWFPTAVSNSYSALVGYSF